METKHTPGPWVVDGKVIRTKHGCQIAMFSNMAYSTLQDWQQNARLIAAAPDLLDIAQSILAEDMLPYLPAEFVAKVRATIAKATGQ